MARPGVKTVLRDNFRTTSRSDIPDTLKVGGAARRGNEKIALASDDTWYNEANYPDTDSPTFKYYTNRRAGDDETSYDDSPVEAPRDWEAVRIQNEQEVINSFDANLDGSSPSEVRRCYNDLVAGGAARVWLIAAPADTTDTELVNSDNLDNLFGAVELEEIDIIALHGRGGSTSAGFGSTTDVGYYADDGGSAAQDVADWCKTITDRSNPVFAVMGIQPASVDSEGLTASELSTSGGHLELADLPAEFDNGAYLSVPVTELRAVGSPDAEYSNGAAFYAGFVSSLDAEMAPTGKTVYNVEELRYIPTRAQQQTLLDKGVVPIGVNQNRTPKIIDGQTFATDASHYKRLSTLRIVFDAISLVRQVAERFIGMPATLHHRNALETDLTSHLRGMVVNGALLSSDFTVNYIPRENRAVIDLILQPAFELRNIEVRVAIQL